MRIYLAWLLLGRLGTKRRSLDRVFTESADLAERPEADSALTGWLRRWLFLAGYRQPAAAILFITTMLMAIGVGLATAVAVLQFRPDGGIVCDHPASPAAHRRSYPAHRLLGALDGALDPGAPAVDARRRARRQRVEKMEQDLPISLELLATLSEAGLGFDTALSRVLDSVMEDRPWPVSSAAINRTCWRADRAWNRCGGCPAAWKFRR